MHHLAWRKQLFLDEYLIADQRGVTLTVNPPTKAGLVDVQATTAPSVVEYGGTCYLYQGLSDPTQVWTSADGLDWEPRGTIQGAAAAPGLHSGINSVSIDPNDAEYPFKGLYELFRQTGPRAGDTGAQTQAVQPGGLYLCRSRDGLDWEYLPKIAVPFLCDTQNQVLYDPWRERYVAYVRAFPEVSGPHRYKRCVGRTETADLYAMPWPHGNNPANTRPAGYDFPYINDELAIVLAEDADDPPMTDLYNPCMHVYAEAPDTYLAFPSMYRCWGYGQKNTSAGRDHRGTGANDGLFETQLAVSRDGIHFTRYRVPYLCPGMVRDRAGTQGDLDCGLVMMGVGMLQRGDEIWQYYYGARRTHEERASAAREGRVGEGIFRVVQRLDGFVSVDAGARGGEFTTPVLTFAGARLLLNAACHGLGEIWVEIQDEAGVPIPGFAHQEAPASASAGQRAASDTVSIDRNGTAQEVWWRSGPDVSTLAGRPVRLRFVMRSAKLFAFQFAEGT